MGFREHAENDFLFVDWHGLSYTRGFIWSLWNVFCEQACNKGFSLWVCVDRHGLSYRTGFILLAGTGFRHIFLLTRMAFREHGDKKGCFFIFANTRKGGFYFC